MKTLSEALPPIKRSAYQEEQSENTSSMEAPSCTTIAGQMNTTSSKTNLTERKQQQSMVICEPKTLTSDEKKKLTILITETYKALKTYGKTPDELEALIMFMHMTLGDKPYKDIRAAFIQHIKESPEVPTPSDIIKRLPLPPKPNGLTEGQFKRLKQLREEQGCN